MSRFKSIIPKTSLYVEDDDSKNDYEIGIS